jgi:Concanavalin A-like lectin/glucanases superfamily
MSVRFDASADGYSATTGLPGTAFTALCWGRLAVDRNAYSTFLSVDNNSASQVLAIQTTTSGNDPYLWCEPHGVGWLEEAPDIVLTVGSWYRMAMSRNGTAIAYYLATAAGAVSSVTGTLTGGLTASRLRVGQSPSSGEWLNGNIANLKVYNAALTQAEIVTEWGNWRAQRTANLLRHHKWQTAAETTDYSGNGWALTAAGTPVFEATNPTIDDSSPSVGTLLRIGATAPAALRIGTTPVPRAYLGSTLVWGTAP